MLKDTYNIVKQHDASDIVIAFGGNDFFDPTQLALYNTGSFADASYRNAAQVWAYGAANYCDAISLHAYADNTGNAWLLNETPTRNGVTSKFTIQQLWNGSIKAYEQLTGKPIWFTETGEPIDSPPNDSTPPTISNSLQKQAVFLNQTFNLLSSIHLLEQISGSNSWPVKILQYRWSTSITLDEGANQTAHPAATECSKPCINKYSNPNSSANSFTNTHPN